MTGLVSLARQLRGQLDDNVHRAAIARALPDRCRSPAPHTLATRVYEITPRSLFSPSVGSSATKTSPGDTEALGAVPSETAQMSMTQVAQVKANTRRCGRRGLPHSIYWRYAADRATNTDACKAFTAYVDGTTLVEHLRGKALVRGVYGRSAAAATATATAAVAGDAASSVSSEVRRALSSAGRARGVGRRATFDDALALREAVAMAWLGNYAGARNRLPWPARRELMIALSDLAVLEALTSFTPLVVLPCIRMFTNANLERLPLLRDQAVKMLCWSRLMVRTERQLELLVRQRLQACTTLDDVLRTLSQCEDDVPSRPLVPTRETFAPRVPFDRAVLQALRPTLRGSATDIVVNSVVPSDVRDAISALITPLTGQAPFDPEWAYVAGLSEPDAATLRATYDRFRAATTDAHLQNDLRHMTTHGRMRTYALFSRMAQMSCLRVDALSRNLAVSQYAACQRIAANGTDERLPNYVGSVFVCPKCSENARHALAGVLHVIDMRGRPKKACHSAKCAKRSSSVGYAKVTVDLTQAEKRFWCDLCAHRKPMPLFTPAECINMVGRSLTVHGMMTFVLCTGCCMLTLFDPCELSADGCDYLCTYCALRARSGSLHERCVMCNAFAEPSHWAYVFDRPAARAERRTVYFCKAHGKGIAALRKQQTAHGEQKMLALSLDQLLAMSPDALKQRMQQHSRALQYQRAQATAARRRQHKRRATR